LSGVVLADGFPITGNTSIRTQMTLPGAIGNDAIGVQVRRNDATNAGYSAGIHANGIGFIVRETGSVFLDSTSDAAHVTQEDVLLQIDAMGSNLQMWVWRPGEKMPVDPLLNADDNVLPGGVISLFAVNLSGNPDPEGAFRYVLVNTQHIPEPSLCDFNADLVCDVTDVDLMFGRGDLYVGVQLPPDDSAFDINGDTLIDSQDVNQWLADAASENGYASSYLLGDANLDGTVNATDLNALAVNWQSDSAVWSSGDFTGEGSVNASDLNVIGSNWRKSIGSAAAAHNVPEPSSLMLLLIVVGSIAASRVASRRQAGP
jgi:hypothetical protein